jgi:hypothetical protein
MKGVTTEQLLSEHRALQVLEVQLAEQRVRYEKAARRWLRTDRGLLDAVRNHHDERGLAWPKVAEDPSDEEVRLFVLRDFLSHYHQLPSTPVLDMLRADEPSAPPAPVMSFDHAASLAVRLFSLFRSFSSHQSLSGTHRSAHWRALV